jgi:hypothetical protein
LAPFQLDDPRLVIAELPLQGRSGTETGEGVNVQQLVEFLHDLIVPEIPKPEKPAKANIHRCYIDFK